MFPMRVGFICNPFVLNARCWGLDVNVNGYCLLGVGWCVRVVEFGLWV
jgi:hypothetical protein